ncbi:GNAT family N-acetyltransferase [Paenibacillus sp. GSMTC-2017]|uniref:GNAT family N-acetyltransferase n=1 Tax=Paenibacillus sp. GSMTC-2017 TaxID=2794350 RepID=UPI0018D79E0D|nr:GNAT family N-acetyltransferase [Paenibacillus sp. GSMTC-2017]MBH5319613.1 GNAT family N-acetyltransferase [Paenibacillus sp. GSMTC-2017]
MSLHLEEVTAANWREVAALQVAEEQGQFIESNSFSMAESLFEGNGISLALYDGEMLVGYAMYGWYSEEKQSIWLDRFMIDQQYQGRGYAKRFIALLLDYMSKKVVVKKVNLSLHPDNQLAMKLYESFGFRLTGAIDDDGPVVGVVMERINEK